MAKAVACYEQISKKLHVKMHSVDTAIKRFDEISKRKETFINLSRDLAKKAQIRETSTLQPKEKVMGSKANLIIRNYLGGLYCFTCDDVDVQDKRVLLTEAKHTKSNKLPSIDDIKDGLLKMVLFCNLENITFDGKNFIASPILKFTSSRLRSLNTLSQTQKELLKLLLMEAKANKFNLMLNSKLLT